MAFEEAAIEYFCKIRFDVALALSSLWPEKAGLLQDLSIKVCICHFCENTFRFLRVPYSESNKQFGEMVLCDP